MGQVTAKDGTSIAYHRSGAGPPVILLRAGFVERSAYASLAAALAEHFTVFNCDRRAQGDSGNTLPYALEREIEDVAALSGVAVAQSGGALPSVFGVSSGGALALEAAAAGVQLHRIAVYEVPYCVAGDTPKRWRDYVDGLWVALVQGRLDDALELFMRFSGCSEFEIVSARNSPHWAGLATEAYKLAYDAASTGDGQPPADRLAAIRQPALVATGGVPASSRPGMKGMPPDFYDRAADAIAACIPRAQRLVFDGRSHEPDPAETAQALGRFFAGGAGGWTDSG